MIEHIYLVVGTADAGYVPSEAAQELGQEDWWDFCFACLTREEAEAQFASILKQLWERTPREDLEGHTFTECVAACEFRSSRAAAEIVRAAIAPEEKQKLQETLRAHEAAQGKTSEAVRIYLLLHAPMQRKTGMRGEVMRRAFVSQERAKEALHAYVVQQWDDYMAKITTHGPTGQCGGKTISLRLEDVRLYRLEWFHI